MKYAVAAFALFSLVACSTAKPPEPVVDPATDPSIVGAVDEAVREGMIEGTAAAHAGRHAGRVAGVLAAVLGGPEYESLDDMIDRYRFTRDAVEATTAIAGATHGTIAGARRGYQLDLQFAELRQIEGLEVYRPLPDRIDVYFAAVPSRDLLVRVAAVFAAREERLIFIEASGDAALDVRDALIDLGMASRSMSARRNDRVKGIVMRIGYRD